MPELPDIELYVSRLSHLVAGQRLEALRVKSPFWLRTVAPATGDLVGRTVAHTSRLGKRIVLAFDGDFYAVLHLMIAGRLRWRPPRAPIPGKLGLGAFDFATGTLLVTEAASRKRASLHLLQGKAALEALRPEGVEPLEVGVEELGQALRRENRTLKRALTDPRIVSGVGNAYSDEVLFAAGLSPVRLTRQLSDGDLAALHSALQTTLQIWTARLAQEVGTGFPEHVTAFRAEMAVHGRFGKPCPRCGSPVQRIRHAENEANYCPRCQTGGKLLADRALSRLLRQDWPRSLEELEERRERLLSEAERPSAVATTAHKTSGHGTRAAAPGPTRTRRRSSDR